MKTNRRIYIDHTGKKLVTEDSPEECEKLFKVHGQEVTQAEMDQWKGQIEKYIQGYVKKTKPKYNKMSKPESDKGVDNGGS